MRVKLCATYEKAANELIVSSGNAKRNYKGKKGQRLSGNGWLETYCRRGKMVGRVRLERTTNWLKANCSTD